MTLAWIAAHSAYARAIAAVLLLGTARLAADDFPEGFPEAWKTNAMRERESRELATGVHYYHYHFDNLEGQPLSVYYVVINWDRADVKLKLAQAGPAVKTVREQVADKHPVAAINGAYFKWKSQATGKVDTYFPLKVDGRLFMPADPHDIGTAIAFNDGEFPRIVKQDDIGPFDNAIMGYHIWTNGVFTLGGENHRATLCGDTPLTAVGINAEKRLVAFLVADGRFKDDAPGINFYGEGVLLKAVGCTDVVSLDGGGSCTMLIRNSTNGLDLVNHPSDNRRFDHEGARAVQNCLYLVGKP